MPARLPPPAAVDGPAQLASVDPSGVARTVRLMNEKRSPSLIEVAVFNLRKAGRSRTRAMVEGAQMCSLIWAWAKTTRDLGREPTRFEHAQHWSQTERQVYAELRKFRDAFPGQRDPQELANWLNSTVAERVGREVTDAGLMTLAAPQLVMA